VIDELNDWCDHGYTFQETGRIRAYFGHFDFSLFDDCSTRERLWLQRTSEIVPSEKF
jgi:hypothetical protein